MSGVDLHPTRCHVFPEGILVITSISFTSFPPFLRIRFIADNERKTALFLLFKLFRVL